MRTVTKSNEITISLPRSVPRPHPAGRSDTSLRILKWSPPSTPSKPPNQHLPNNSSRKPSRKPRDKPLRHPPRLRLNPWHPPPRLGHSLMCLSRRTTQRSRPRRHPFHCIFPASPSTQRQYVFSPEREYDCCG